MLNRGDNDEGLFGDFSDFEVEYDEAGKANGIKVAQTLANAKVVVGDPSYFPALTEKKGSVVRAIAILDQPVEATNNNGSYQVIFPGAYIGRKNDLYLFCCNGAHKVAPAGKFVAFVSTTVEGDCTGMSVEAIAHRELAAGLALLKSPVRIFYDMYDLMEPKSDGATDNVFISKSFDATTHFETAITDVLEIYERIMGEKLVLTNGPAAPEQ